eukprot:CAMPEP_0114565986 /NCGR_PEP_ID=MMETSP0114-20121206/14630_1 /TAXON_ID=31324 /ORGANISM="Goniomonas sp, Strain m" /LENGTH=50 /DNA_ID=CAMNT_0001752325 /DNA_START=23 /DNA_END=175 /DNA_ORIENTATION=-
MCECQGPNAPAGEGEAREGTRVLALLDVAGLALTGGTGPTPPPTLYLPPV